MRKHFILYIFCFSFVFFFSGCGSDDDPILEDEKIDPNTIATENLILYFPFDGNAVDEVGSLTPEDEVFVGYVGGMRGKALQGMKKGYVVYEIPSTHPLRSLTEGFTISTWIRSNKITSESFPVILQISNPDYNIWGSFTWYQKNLSSSRNFMWYSWQAIDSDSIYIINELGLDSINNQFIPAVWEHFILSYEASTQQIKLFKDGNHIEELDESISGFDFRGAENLIIGTWQPLINKTKPKKWMNWFEGNLDELRIYNRSLSEEEALLLYKAEKSQAN